MASHHLDEATPYVWPRDGTLTLFLCRWPAGAVIPVAFPLDASEDERAALEAALRAWESAGLGVRFQRVEQGEELVTIRFDDESSETATGEGVGSTIAECRLGDASASGDPLPAQMRGAVVRVARRTPKNPLHRDRALTSEQIAGIALHELGHALGFQGHVSHGDTAMVRSRDEITARGRAAMNGERLGDATLRALYSLPSGAVVRRSSVGPSRTDVLDRLAQAALRLGLRGPFVRVGDRDGRVFWRDADGEEYGVVVADVARSIREPGWLVLLPEQRTRVLLEEALP